MRFAKRAGRSQRSTVRDLLRLAARPEIISFAGGLPAPELFPVEEVEDACRAVLRRRPSAALQYGETEGVPELRSFVADSFGRGLATVSSIRLKAENVMIVSGSQQALDLIAKVFIDPDDLVAVEEPTYLSMLSAFRAAGAQFLPLASDSDGMCVEALERTREHVRLVYTVPNFQNPKGTTMSSERRGRLARLAARGPMVAIEDDPYGLLRYEGEELPPVMTLGDRNEVPAQVIYVGTFSKVLAPGLRVGYVVADTAIIHQLVTAKQSTDLHTSTLCQEVVLALLEKGTLERQLPRLRDVYRSRRDAMLSALRAFAPAGTRWTNPEGGMFVFVWLPDGCDAAALLAPALDAGVAFVPGQDFHLGDNGRATMRLNFTNVDEARIDAGIRALFGLLQG